MQIWLNIFKNTQRDILYNQKLLFWPSNWPFKILNYLRLINPTITITDIFKDYEEDFPEISSLIESIKSDILNEREKVLLLGKKGLFDNLWNKFYKFAHEYGIPYAEIPKKTSSISKYLRTSYNCLNAYIRDNDELLRGYIYWETKKRFENHVENANQDKKVVKFGFNNVIDEIENFDILHINLDAYLVLELQPKIFSN